MGNGVLNYCPTIARLIRAVIIMGESFDCAVLCPSELILFISSPSTPCATPSKYSSPLSASAI